MRCAGSVHATVAISHAEHRRAVRPRLRRWRCICIRGCRAATCRSRSFALFIGVAMSITAFPVLARILTDRGMTRTQLGVVALTCAAVDDVTAWCLLAFVVGVVQAPAGGALSTIVLTLAFIAVMFLVRPAARGPAGRSARPSVSRRGA